MMIAVLKWFRLFALAIGLGLFFSAERYFTTYDFYLPLKLISFALLGLSVLIPIWLAIDSRKRGLVGESKSYLLLFIWQLIVVLSPLIYMAYAYFLQDSVYPQDFIGKVLLAGWLVALTLGGFLGIGFEINHYTSGKGPLAEPKRMATAGGAWLLVGILGCIMVCLNYAGAKKNRSYDWSYLKATTPGESSIKMVQNLEKDMDVAVFFPHTNEVKPFVADYFDFLAKNSNRIKLAYYDKDLFPTKAGEYNVSRNGKVVLRYENKKRTIEVGLKISRARSVLNKLDSKFQKEFLALTAAKKVAHFTRGHGEMSWVGQKSSIRSIRGLEILFRSQNFSLKTFGGVDGSMQAIDADASMVVVAGAQKPFLKEEVEVLKEYLNGGGKLLLFLDNDISTGKQPLLTESEESKDPLLEYLSSLGVNYNRTFLANDKRFVVATRTKVDRLFLYTNIFGSHKSTLGMSRHDDKIQVLFYRSGYFELGKKGSFKISETIKSLSSTFNDTDLNYKFDSDREKRKSYPIGIALQLTKKDARLDGKKAGKIIAFSDASVISDFLLRNPGNQLLLLDALKWLVDEIEISGNQVSEEDVEIRPLAGQDIIMFYGTIFLVPILVLIFGFFANKKRRLMKVGIDA